MGQVSEYAQRQAGDDLPGVFAATQEAKMKTKKIDYWMAVKNSHGYGKINVTGYAVDHKIRFCVRDDLDRGWSVDCFNTGFTIGTFYKSKDEAIKKGIAILKERAGVYDEKIALALDILRKNGLI